MKTCIKKNRKIVGFVGKNSQGYFYAFGKPSQASYLAFECKSIEEGIEKIKSVT